MSLGEPLKHNALLVEDALEPLLEGRVAPPLLDVLSDGGTARARYRDEIEALVRSSIESGGRMTALLSGMAVPLRW